MDSNATTAATVVLGEKRKPDNQDYVLEEDHEEDSVFATTHDCDHPDHENDDENEDSNFGTTHHHPDLLDRGIFAYVDEDDYEVYYDDYGEPFFFYCRLDANIRSSSPIGIPDSLRDCPSSPPHSPPLGTLEPATPELLKALDENCIAFTPDPTSTTKQWSFSAFQERREERRRKRLCLALDRLGSTTLSSNV